MELRNNKRYFFHSIFDLKKGGVGIDNDGGTGSGTVNAIFTNSSSSRGGTGFENSGTTTANFSGSKFNNLSIGFENKYSIASLSSSFYNNDIGVSNDDAITSLLSGTYIKNTTGVYNKNGASISNL